MEVRHAEGKVAVTESGMEDSWELGTEHDQLESRRNVF